jgi:threonine aldolase
MIDLRSDTVTLPTPAMREAMARAEVGDDVFGEDPTVNRLEEMAAERMGKEAAMFVPSGTMANLSALLTHCNRGDEAIMGDRAHTFLYEAGGSAALGGIHPYPLPNRPDGTLDLEQLEAAIRPDNVHFPRTRLICLENTHNRCGGAVLPPAYLRAVQEIARRHGLAVHMDGARIFNAAVALGVEAQDLAQYADSVSFCLSKGLCAPVGSLVCGPAEFIARARRARKILGGGMRQAGIIAAAGIVALAEMVDRLEEDHRNAHRLADGIRAMQGLRLSYPVRSNIVMFKLMRNDLDGATLVQRWHEAGLAVLSLAPGEYRAVVHHGISADDIDTALQVIRESLG